MSLKESFLTVGGLFLPITFPVLVTFKDFGMDLQKGSVYLNTKSFLSPLLYFWNYNPFPNGQIVFLIGVQAHQQIQLLRAESYKVLKVLYCGISPTKKIEEEFKLQPYILSFLYFVARNQYRKTPIKVSIKVQRIIRCLYRMSIQNVTFRCIFVL